MAIRLIPGMGAIDETLSGVKLVPGFGFVQEAGVITATPTGTITSQTGPGGAQTVQFVGTATDATSGTYSFAASNGGVPLDPQPFAVTDNAFSFAVTQIPAGDYVPTLTVTGPGGTAQVTGTQSFSVLGVTGGGEISPDPGEEPETPVVAAHHAMVVAGGAFRAIRDDELGTGLVPVVLHQARLQRRQAQEGVPVVKIAGKLTLLPDGDTLLI